MTMSEDRIALSGPEYKRDPYPLYEQLRNAGPVHAVRFPSGVDAWLVTGYEAARAALSDGRLGKSHTRGNAAWRERAAVMPEPLHSQLQVHLLHQDPPKHSVMRRLIVDAFAPRRVEAMRPRIQQLADGLVDAMPAGGGAEIVDCFAAPFPLLVLAEVIGLPPELIPAFRREWAGVVSPVGPHDPRRGVYEGLLQGLQGYIARVVDRCRCGQPDSLITRLVLARDDGLLSAEELDSMIFQLLVAGQEPVTNQITAATLALLTHPEQMARLHSEPEMLTQAVEELLRYDSAFELTTWRFFAEESDLHGSAVPAGDSVIVSLCAANRDPREFADPDRLDLDRTPNPHLAFGHGIHRCPAADLARVELQVALRTLLSRLTGLALEVPDGQVDWTPAVLGRQLTRLPVVFTERR